MNQVLLKQQRKKQEKPKEKKQILRATSLSIEEKLIEHFRNHIGISEKTTQEEIFQVVIGVNSYQVDSFSRFYWWEVIEKIIRKLRRQDKCFIIKNKGCFYVLQSQEEAEYYKSVCDKAIEHMENAKIRADEWVDKEKWRKLNEEETYVEEEPIKSQEELINEDIDKSKRKIIKIYRGETE